jgi:hypothetical protein
LKNNLMLKKVTDLNVNRNILKLSGLIHAHAL